MPELKELPLVSIVLATYNGEKFLEQQLESLFRQTYPRIELIAVDDGSQDTTVQILRKYAGLHPDMRVLVNESNLGYIKNFEKGGRLSHGEFIAFCDQDDYWFPEKIEKMVTAIGEYPMIYCDSLLCDENLKETGMKISDRVVCKLWDNCLQLAVFCRIYGHATLIKKELFQNALPFLSVIPHDWWLSYTATLHGGIKYMTEPLVFYRQHTANLFGVIGGKSKKDRQLSKIQKKRQEIEEIRIRTEAFYHACPPHLIKEKKTLLVLFKSYRNFSLLNNIRRVCIFFTYYPLFLAAKKRSTPRNWLFCLKMFIMIK